jgi:hypothetical protein
LDHENEYPPAFGSPAYFEFAYVQRHDERRSPCSLSFFFFRRITAQDAAGASVEVAGARMLNFTGDTIEFTSENTLCFSCSAQFIFEPYAIDILFGYSTEYVILIQLGVIRPIYARRARIFSR